MIGVKLVTCFMQEKQRPEEGPKDRIFIFLVAVWEGIIGYRLSLDKRALFELVPSETLPDGRQVRNSESGIHCLSTNSTSLAFISRMRLS